jgi:hypothetical protein
MTSEIDSGDWFHDGDTWYHCGRPAVIGDDNVECSKCQEDWPDDETVAE